MSFKNESGRSMVEMLGVLAIIGVLSVAGIAGYTIAMRKHKANEITHAISMLAVTAKTANNGEGVTSTTSYATLIGQNPPSYVTKLEANADADKTITLETDTEELCNAVADNLGETGLISVKSVGRQCDNGGNTLVITVAD